MANYAVNFSLNNKELNVHPNPPNNFIQVKGLHQAEDYVFYNFRAS